ncbi:MAG: protein kinase [Gemmatimonadetes bacterium]|nr:protein kinase [Gemmatimonadota bacterium]
MPDLLERLKHVLADRYTIEKELGSGGMATVYLAEDLKHGRPVAIKVLRPEVAATVGPDRFLREIAIAAQLEHPHVLTLIDSGESGGFLYYVMPVVAGESLRDRLRRENQLSVEEAIEIARDVADALSFAHRNEVVHRDIKPENILLANGHAIVADFGIAQAVCASCGDNTTLAGASVGTPGYMSPEQAMGDEVDPRTDVYSLGAVLYEMLAGSAPYAAENAQATLARQVVDPVPSVRKARPDVPKALDAAVRKALAKNPAERTETAAAFAEMLGRASAATASPSFEVLAGPRGRGSSRRTRTAALLAVLLLAGVDWWWFSVSGTGPSRIESLAVLPFSNLSADPEQQYFVDGMHDALITELARIHTLTVISRTSVMRFRDTDISIPEIGIELSVDAVLEGSVFKVGDSVRITAQLIGVVPERHLWAQTYDGDLGDVLRLHSEVARAIARAIEAELTPEETERLSTVRRVDPAAHDAFLQGRFHHAKGTVAGYETAIGYYSKAIEKAPTFAPAHAALALSIHLLGVSGGLPAHDTEPRARASAERALELDDRLAEARAVLAGIKSMYEWDWVGAERDYRRAIELDPSSAIAHQWYAYHLSSAGRHEEAIARARRGLELDPLNPMGRVVVADQLVFARRFERAIAELVKALEMDPTLDRAGELLEWNYAQLGRYDGAVALRRERLIRTNAGGSGAAAAEALEAAFSASGARGYWRWRLERLQRDATVRYVAPSEFAAVYAALGEKDAALEWLEEAYQQRDAMELLDVWPGHDPLRSDPRFEDLLRRLNFPQ